MDDLKNYKIGQVGAYIHDHLTRGTFTQAQVPASVGLGMIAGLVGSLWQLEIRAEPRFNLREDRNVEQYLDFGSLPVLTEEQSERLRSDHRESSLKQSLFAIESAPTRFADLANKCFVCVADFHDHVFVYKHDWSWYVITLRNQHAISAAEVHEQRKEHIKDIVRSFMGGAITAEAMGVELIKTLKEIDNS